MPKPIHVCAVWLLAAAVLAGADTERAAEPLFLPRVVDARVDAVALERVDVSMQMAVTASRNVTIRSFKFSDGFIDRIPVWITPLEGRWSLRRGEEFVIPDRIAVTAFARDALGAGSLAELVGRKDVDARAVVEMSFETPWLARMFGTATDVAITDVAFKAPVPTTALPQSLTRLGAGVLEFFQRTAAPMIAARAGAGGKIVVDRFGPSIATVETDYEIEGGPRAGRRTSRTLGVWWTPSIYCTTREAFEPWRYGAADASQLQLQGARLRAAATRTRVLPASGPPIDVDAAALRRQLPAPAERRVYSLVTGEPRRMRLALRTAPSALVCLRLRDQDGPPLPAAAAPAPAAAFAGEASRGLVWTETVPGDGTTLTLRTPVHRQSLGSPLVTADAVVGLVASTDTGWDVRAIALAAARAVRPSGGTTRATH
ncbi:MAG TPA: hypothetical protein VFO31_05785 [Vicinamibacterales bacterium]|nr:hypothetical protein [Vicinamibacterales bacterium]